MNRRIMLVLPTDWSPRKTILYFIWLLAAVVLLFASLDLLAMIQIINCIQCFINLALQS